jgi:Tfp pilus assembly protein PilF
VSLEEEVHRLKAKAAAERGRVAQAQGDLEAASYFYAHSLEWADTPEARVGQAQALSYEGKLDQAMAECKKAIALDPEQGQAYNDIGVYLMQQGDEDAAIPWLQQSLDAASMEDRHFPYYNLGRIFERKQQLSQAAAAYEAALLANPAFDSAKSALARVRGKLERPVGNEP